MVENSRRIFGLTFDWRAVDYLARVYKRPPKETTDDRKNKRASRIKRACARHLRTSNGIRLLFQEVEPIKNRFDANLFII